MKRPIEIFSVGTDFIQVVMRADGPHELRVGDETQALDGPIGVATFGDLTPGTRHDVMFDGRPVARPSTLPLPSGALLAKVATVSDTHIGETGFLHYPRMRSQPRGARFAEAHPVWALRAAAGEIDAWAPAAVVVKGDLSHTDSAEEFELAIEILHSIRAPLIAEQGNHDGGNHQDCDAVAVAAGLGLTFDRGVVSHRVGAANVLMVESNVVGKSSGSVRAHTTAAVAAIDPSVPTLVFLHHQLARWPIPTFIPVGVHQPEANEFLRSISGASTRLLVSSGHSHRNRARRSHGIPVTEVGSTKDFPGVWAGYEIYEGGIVQSLHRITDPRVLAWTESTRRAMFGTWGLWSPGRLDDRSLSYRW